MNSFIYERLPPEFIEHLSCRAANILDRNNITSRHELKRVLEQGICVGWRNCGKRTLAELRRFVEERFELVVCEKCGDEHYH